MSNYVISLKHTRQDEPVITLWRANNAGYTVNIASAGIYENPEEGYHIDSGNIARPKYMVDPLLKKMTFGDFKDKLMLPNTKEVWKALGHSLT